MAHLLTSSSSEDRIGNLPKDIWCLILNELYLDSPKSIHSVSVTSKLLHHLAARYVYRSVYLREEHLANLENPGSAYGGTVKSKLVASTNEVIVGNAAAAALLTKLLPSIRNLKYLRWKWWEKLFPISVLEGLHQHHPKARLCIEQLSTRLSQKGWEQEAVEISFKRLSHSPNIHLIDFSFDVAPTFVEPLKKCIISCQNLKILRLCPSPDRVYDLMAGSWRWSFHYEEGDRFPSLQELTLQDYGLESDDSCSKIWDCSMLIHLELRNCQEIPFLEALRKLQPCIRTLILDNESYRLYHLDRSFEHPDLAASLLDGLVLSCLDLEHLHVSSVPGRLPLLTIAKHGSTLRSLTIRERDRWNPGVIVPSPSLTAEDLDFVHTSCPHLESLTVDMERSEQWDYAFLNSLSRFRHVRTICLYLEAAYARENFRKVGVDTTSARRLFGYLHDSKLGVPLDLLHLVVGEPILHKTAGPREAASDKLEREFFCSMDNAGLAIIVGSQAEAIRREEEYFANFRVEWAEERQAQEAAQIEVENMVSAGVKFDEVLDGATGLDDVDLFGD
ncbi:MAG: hypothetical protein M1830_000147 [Pleopsidium flavum]|nr:MAG: hypothetical protein M1830_000147 [Pleopsidium flavum]